MCGISGKLYFTPEKRITEQEVHRMNERIKHRGPDDEGVYINQNGKVGLGHLRLAIIDLSPAGHMPMCNEDGTVWIVFNGEIYNFQELRPDLEKRGHKFKSNTDTEVIIHLWEEHGENCLQYLRGMFAFAIWDENQQKLFLARDRLGKKPLKYYIGEDFFVFASELKAFIDEPGVLCEVDYPTLLSYLSFPVIPSPKTGFRKIHKLPAAHYLTVDLSQKDPRISEPQRYWALDFSSKLRLTEEEWCATILEKLAECVRLRLIADVPLGAFLSGGIDSSAIVALMAKQSSKPVKTFSIGFAEKIFNELPYAKLVAQKYNTDHTEFIVEPNAIEVLPKLVFHYEEPYGDSSSLPTYYLSQLTRQHVTVALNGDGGDENFAGYPWYFILRLSNLYQRLPKPLRILAHKTVKQLYTSHPSYLLRYAEIALRGSLISPQYLHQELLSYFNAAELAEASNHSLKSTTTTENHSNKYSKFTDPIDTALARDIQSYLADDLLVKVDIASMAHALEVRSPFLDHEFMELTSKIPSQLKVRGYHYGKNGKYLLKKAVQPLLPAELFNRKKQGFSIPVDAWFKGPLQKFSQNILLDPSAFVRTIIKPEFLEKLLRHEHDIGIEGRQIWILLTLELWHQNFFIKRAKK